MAPLDSNGTTIEVIRGVRVHARDAEAQLAELRARQRELVEMDTSDPLVQVDLAYVTAAIRKVRQEGAAR